MCIHDPQRDRNFVKKKRSVQELTNNDLEYLAVINGIEYCRKLYPRDKILIASDSQLIVNHINSVYRCHTPNLVRLLAIVKKKMKRGDRIIWLPRESNLAGIHLEKFY